ncbi:CLUMA_CG012422, isoform A [Clunio marinus]|uniref:CLUMA_CG012422, isoform A n=1 Tax=Clunio marinus TaxID=568069 RepID=A0A1J1IEL4_9DIPT|nr:CLUMA_CG012422, isoform A [Clunio marinus]
MHKLCKNFTTLNFNIYATVTTRMGKKTVETNEETTSLRKCQRTLIITALKLIRVIRGDIISYIDLQHHRMLRKD